ncbi:MAG: T9SS type A sorting domain-containing protein, partial [Bacteroidetes bacterium]|nr:T9SS type A sorting domain-containing protein [Bacteroidota bacterium]
DGKNIFYSGDLNVYRSSEACFQLLTAQGTHKLYDPAGQIGDWTNNSSFSKVHTQSTRTSSFGGGSTGGMDDRFDWILISGDLIRGQNGIQYITDSYQAIGQDGNRFNRSVVFGTNQAVSETVANALHEMSDHLPVSLQVNVKYDKVSVQNPINNNIELHGNNITNKGEDAAQIEIYNLQGQLVYFQLLESNGQLNVANAVFKNGIHIIKAQNSFGTKIEKVAIAR